MPIFFDAKQNVVEKPENEEIFWRLSVYPVVFSNEGKVLMIYSKFTSKYEFPGGAIEVEETLSEGVARECYEETGYKIKLESLTPFYSGEQFFWGHIKKKFFHSIQLFYEAELLSDKQNIEAINSDGVEETEKVEWKSLEELDEQNCHPIHFPVIKILREK